MFGPETEVREKSFCTSDAHHRVCLDFEAGFVDGFAAFAADSVFAPVDVLEGVLDPLEAGFLPPFQFQSHLLILHGIHPGEPADGRVEFHDIRLLGVGIQAFLNLLPQRIQARAKMFQAFFGHGNGGRVCCPGHIIGNFLLLVWRMFFSLMPVEKPALGRGLDALMSGGKGAAGKKATDMLASFQGKRTRVGKGLNAFIKGSQGTTTGAPQPKPASPEPGSKPTPASEPSPAPPTQSMPELNSMRARRQRKSTPAPAPKPATLPNYRRSRRPRPSTNETPPATEKSDPAPARLFVGSTNAPVAKAFSALSPAPQATPRTEPEPNSELPPPKKPQLVRPQQSPAEPTPGTKGSGNPGFRMSLFAVDWFLLAMAFYVALHLEAGSNVALSLCVLAVVVGAVLGVWGLILETEEGED